MTRYRRSTLLAAIICSCICAFQLWFLDVGTDGISHPESRGDLVDSYVDALASGKASLQTTTAKMAELPADQQPPTDVRFRILDASFFEGKYYVYYGILPFAAALVPWKLLTGSYLDAESYIGVMLLLGNGFVLLSFIRLYGASACRRMGFVLPLGVGIALTCSGSFALMDLPGIHQLESATGYGLNCAAFFGIISFTQAGVRRYAWLQFAVAAAALLMACRPNQVAVPACLAVLSIYWILRAEMAVVQKKRLLGSTLLILAVIGAGLGIFNYNRFGDVREFGMSYGTGAVGREEVVGFSTSKIPYNLKAYLFGRFQPQPYFPFIGGALHPELDLKPGQHEGFDQVYGMFVVYPALIFWAAALYYSRVLAVVFSVPALCTLLLLSGLGFGTYRYSVDFGVFMALLAGVGCVEWLRRSSGLCLSARWAGAVVVAIASAVGAVCVAASIASIHGLLPVRRGSDFALLAGPFDAVRYRLEGTLVPEPRTISAEVRFPEKYGAVEPLLVTGRHGLQDFIYIHYYDRGFIRIGFESMGRGGKVSDPIPVDYGRIHRLDFVTGGRFPPSDHPILNAVSGSEISVLRQRLDILIDGVSVFRIQNAFHPSGGYEYLGSSPFDSAFGSRFTGEMTARVGLPLREYVGTASETEISR